MIRLAPGAWPRAYRRWVREIPVQPVAWQWIPLVLLAALVGWWLAHGSAWWGLYSGDAHEYALVARRLSEGRGFTTPVVFPAALSFGATQDHPSLLRAPLWPVLLAGGFRIAGPQTAVVHVSVLAFYLGTVAGATALGMALAGRAVGILVGLAVASSPHLASYALDGTTEIPLAFWITLAFLLLGLRRHPAAIGVVCGLAYLTHYNGALLVGVAGIVLAARDSPLRALAWCAAGFAVVAAPWWIRNLVVAGNPFYSLYEWAPYFQPVDRLVATNSSPWYRLEPERIPLDLGAKLRAHVPLLLTRFPLVGINLVATLGVALACVRRQVLPLAFALLVAGAALAAAVTVLNGRYFVPLAPVAVALGAAAWARHGGRLKLPALALVLVASLVPPLTPELKDLEFQRMIAARLRASREPQLLPPPGLARCLAEGPLVLAEDPWRLAWHADVVAIAEPPTSREFWWIVRELPVRYVQKRRFRSVSRADLERRFEPRPDCAPDVYELRAGAERGGGLGGAAGL